MVRQTNEEMRQELAELEAEFNFFNYMDMFDEDIKELRCQLETEN